MFKLERICQERHINDQGRRREAGDRGPDQRRIHVFHMQQTVSLRAHVEAMENLCHRQGQECHGRAVRTGRDLPDACLDIVSDEICS